MFIKTSTPFDLQTLNKELNELMNQQISEQIVDSLFEKLQPNINKDRDPFLYEDLIRYAEQTEQILEEADYIDDDFGKRITKFHKISRLKEEIVKKNGHFIQPFIFLQDEEYEKAFSESEIDFRDYWSIEEALRLIFQVSDSKNTSFWFKETSLSCNLSAVVLYILCLAIEREEKILVAWLREKRYCPDNPIHYLHDEVLEKYPKESSKQTGDKKTEIVNHIIMDEKKARHLYRGLFAAGWIIGPLDENTFVQRLTSDSHENKIKLRQLNQIHYITRKYIFPPEPGKSTRRMKPWEWELIKQVFDTENGDMCRVDTASKEPKNHKKVNHYMSL